MATIAPPALVNEPTISCGNVNRADPDHPGLAGCKGAEPSPPPPAGDAATITPLWPGKCSHATPRPREISPSTLIAAASGQQAQHNAPDLGGARQQQPSGLHDPVPDRVQHRGKPRRWTICPRWAIISPDRPGATVGTRAVAEPHLWLVGYGDWTGFATLLGVGRSARAKSAEI